MMVEYGSNNYADYFDGTSILEALLTPPRPVSRFISPVGDVVSKPVDETDNKLISFLMGRKVYFTNEEVEKYIYY